MMFKVDIWTTKIEQIKVPKKNDRYFETFAQARTFLIKKSESMVVVLERGLQIWKEKLEKAKKLK